MDALIGPSLRMSRSSKMSKFSLVTFGCQMNQHDSDRISEVLKSAGYREASQARTADLIILNTCSVREKAVQKLRSEVGRLGLLKRERPGLLLGVAGCVAQQEGERLLRRLPQVDFIVGPDNIPEIPELLVELGLGSPPRVRANFDLDEPRFLSAKPELYQTRVTAYVTVMKGCDERCSFCIVPYTRGRERYRPAREVIDEVARWVDRGVREVTLLGQTVNSYRDPESSLALSRPRIADEESEFPDLLRAIAREVKGLSRLRYTSPHPRHLTVSLIAAHRELEVLCRHVHMPVQSGSDRVLKRMIRRYSVQEYLERTDRLREAVPGLTLSTDVIVGFPGETRGDFEQTLELVQRVGFTGLFGFKYSPRPHTPALKLGDDVSETEKDARLQELFSLSNRLVRDHLEGLVGTVQQVLVEGRGRTGTYTGRSERNEIVHFAADEPLLGHLVKVRVAEAFNHSLRGQLLSKGPRAGTPGSRRRLPVLGPAPKLGA